MILRNYEMTGEKYEITHFLEIDVDLVNGH